jgi:biopolymer transport protein ExbD
MADMNQQFGLEDAPVIKRRRLSSDTDMDMTPMIDCTFLLLIFFTVAAKLEPDTAVTLPPAQFGKGVDPHRCVMITIAKPATGSDADIYINDGKVGAALTGDAEAQGRQITEAVEAGQLKGQANVLIKAERGVLQRDVARVASAASQVEGVTLNLAVLESDLE